MERSAAEQGWHGSVGRVRTRRGSTRNGADSLVGAGSLNLDRAFFFPGCQVAESGQTSPTRPCCSGSDVVLLATAAAAAAVVIALRRGWEQHCVRP